MDLSFNYIFQYVDHFLLILMRMSSFFFIVPIFGGRNVPAYTKISISLLFSVLVFFAMPIEKKLIFNGIIDYSYAIIREAFVGWILGFVVYLVFTVFFLAGQLIDYQIGFTMVNVLDPLSEIQVPITGNLYYYIILIMLLGFNSHHYIMRALFYSFEVIPLGKAILSPEFYADFLNIYKDIFIIALKIASPIIAIIFIINVSLGILTRAAPQMNMFVVGVPLKLWIGLLAVSATLSMFATVSDYISQFLYDTFFSVLKGLIP